MKEEIPGWFDTDLKPAGLADRYVKFKQDCLLRGGTKMATQRRYLLSGVYNQKQIYNSIRWLN